MYSGYAIRLVATRSSPVPASVVDGGHCEEGLKVKEISVGVIGTGFIGPVHIQALRRMPYVKVAALAEANEETACRKAEILGIGRCYGDYETMLAQGDIDVVHICSPNDLHAPMAKKALLAGKHVVCEKPLAISTAEARDLVETARKTGLVNALHFNVRYYPLIRQLKTMVQKKEMGRIFSIHGSYLQDWLFYETDYNWRLESKTSGKSRAVADIGSHWMDLVEYVSGIRIAEVMADFATVHGLRKKPLRPVETYAGKILKPEDYADVEIDTEDYASMLFRFENGEKGALTVSQSPQVARTGYISSWTALSSRPHGTPRCPTNCGSGGATETMRYS